MGGWNGGCTNPLKLAVLVSCYLRARIGGWSETDLPQLFCLPRNVAAGGGVGVGSSAAPGIGQIRRHRSFLVLIYRVAANLHFFITVGIVAPLLYSSSRESTTTT